jgi:hypothetical protein
LSQHPKVSFVSEHVVGAAVPPELDPDDDPLLELELLELDEELLLLDELEEDEEDEELLEPELEVLEPPELLLLELLELDDELLLELEVDPPLEPVDVPELLELLLLVVPEDEPPFDPEPPTHTLTDVSVLPGSSWQLCPEGQPCDESQYASQVPLMHTRSCPHAATPSVAVHDEPLDPAPLGRHA